MASYLIWYIIVGIIISVFWVRWVYNQKFVDKDQKDFEAGMGIVVIIFLWLPLFVYGLFIRLKR